jgi:RNA polymerase sigma factor (sigma-70 family)
VSASPHPTRPPSSDDEIVLEAMPGAIKLARTIARIWRVRSPELVKDCEQTGCQALLECRPRYDETRGPFAVYAWKRVEGGVTKLLRREAAGGCTGMDDACDETEGFRDTTDMFSAEDADDMGVLKGWCRVLTFRRVLGDVRAPQAGPDHDVMRAQVFEALQAALGGLDDRHMRVVELRYWKGLIWKDVGKEMGISERHVKRLDEEIREHLEGDLRNRGVDEPPSSTSP